MLFKKVAQFITGMVLFSALSVQAATDIRVWCWDANFNIKAVREAAVVYRKTHPDINIVVDNVDKAVILQRINEAIATKDFSKLPDIFLIEDYNSRNYVINYPYLLKDLSSYINKDDFVDYKVSISSNDGKIYGVPFDSGVAALFVRMDLFEEAGYTIEDFNDLTWDKFIQMGRKVRATSSIPLLPYDINDLQEIRIMMQSAQSWYTDINDENKVTIANNAALRESLQHFRRMNYSGLLVKYNGWDDFLHTFQRGKVAAVLAGCWLAPSIESTLSQYNDWRVLHIPKLNTPNANQFSNNGGSQWFVNNSSPRADEAAKFLAETFGKDRDFINKLIPRIGLISAMKHSDVLPNYQKPNAFFGKQLIYMRFTNWNEQVPTVNYGTHTHLVESSVQNALTKYLQGADLQTVLLEAQQEAQNNLQ